ncbi:MAG: D-alanine--D-alanine ligase [Spirochaetales bacterium]|nr:D-alanine--D-alanine ligase [Spirochaetales bacterium]
MNIGLTYDLKDDYLGGNFSKEQLAEFDLEETIAAIEAAITKAGHNPFRIGNITKLVSALAAGQRWDLVFNIAEGIYGPARESQIPALLEAWQIPCVFSDSLVLAVCLDKALAKALVRQAGLPTAPYTLVNRLSDLDEFNLEFPVFCKPVAGGTSQGIYSDNIITGPEQLAERCRLLLERFGQAVLVEEYLPGREFTVGVLGTGEKACSVGALEVSATAKTDSAYYSYDNKQNFETCIRYALATDPVARAAEALALRVWKLIGARDGGRVDIRCDKNGKVSFLEINPLAGLNPEISDLPILCRQKDISYQELIEKILDSAMERIWSLV